MMAGMCVLNREKKNPMVKVTSLGGGGGVVRPPPPAYAHGLSSNTISSYAVYQSGSLHPNHT